MTDKIRKHRVNKAELRKREFRQRIVNAATRLFAERGVAETPITDVIREAGVAHKTFFNHFPSKQHLIVYISDQYFAGARLLFEAAAGQGNSPAAVLLKGFDDIAATIAGLDENTAGMLRQLVMHAHAGFGCDKSRIIHSLYDMVEAILLEAQQQQLLRQDFLLPVYAEIATGIFTSIINNWANQPGYQLPEHMHQAATFIVQTMFVADQPATGQP
ncbi:MAG TPA: TetR/AcrR family transcriptional regulator [Pseudomonadales bacterium]